MKHVGLLAVAAVGLSVAGCAGSGSSAATVIDTTIVGGPRVEAVVSRGGTILTDTLGRPIVQDPRNFEINMEFTFQLVGYKATGERVVLSPDSWVSSDSTATFGNLAANSGLYQTNNSVTRDVYQVGAIYKGTYFTTDVSIHPREIILDGTVVDENTGKGLAGVTVNFYDASGLLLSTVSSSFTGDFRASVPTSATQLQLLNDSIPSAYYRSYMFQGFRYNAGSVDCRASIPTYVVGERSLGDTIKVTPSVAGVGTPDPTGCTP